MARLAIFGVSAKNQFTNNSRNRCIDVSALKLAFGTFWYRKLSIDIDNLFPDASVC